jgi:hypothetical protein
MKKSFIALALLVLLSAFSAMGQAKKPRLVVIPSDALLNKMGLLNTTDDMGEINYVQNYKEAFLDDDLKGCISKIAEIFSDRGFPLTMLEGELRRAQGKNIIIPVDIRLELNYKITKQGPRDILYFELTALDAYSNKQVAASSGQSAPAIGETTVNLLQEAVLDKIDKYISDIDNYFETLVSVGQETRLTIMSESSSIPDDLIDVIEAWLDDNCVNGSYSTDNVDDERIDISQAMKPLYSASGKPLDARNFYKPLKSLIEERGLVVKQKSSSSASQSGGGTLGDAVFIID